jgi:DNA-binding IclR family transcriptional regulator
MATLEVVAERPRRAKEIAEALGLKWATAYRTLAHLEEEEYLRRDPATNAYSIGARLYAVGVAYLSTHPLSHLAPPHLERLAKDLDCVAQVNERQRKQVLTLAIAEGSTRIPKTSPGFSFPLGVAAKGRLLLAFAPDDIREETLAEPLPPYTAHTVTDPARLRAAIEQVAATGQAVTEDDLQVGVGSIAVPVRDRDDAVCACVSVVVSTARIRDEAQCEELLEGAHQAGRMLSMGLGWRPAQVG